MTPAGRNKGGEVCYFPLGQVGFWSWTVLTQKPPSATRGQSRSVLQVWCCQIATAPSEDLCVWRPYVLNEERDLAKSWMMHPSLISTITSSCSRCHVKAEQHRALVNSRVTTYIDPYTPDDLFIRYTCTINTTQYNTLTINPTSAMYWKVFCPIRWHKRRGQNIGNTFGHNYHWVESKPLWHHVNKNWRSSASQS